MKILNEQILRLLCLVDGEHHLTRLFIFQEKSEAELEHNARFWVNALLDRVALKHVHHKDNFQESLNSDEATENS